MKTIITSITGIALLLPVSGYANQNVAEYFAKKFMGGGSSSAPQQRRDAKLECADFNGKWKMKCKVSTNDQITNIVQPSCDLLTVGTEKFHVAGFSAISEFVPNKDYSVHMNFASAFDWNEDKSSLSARIGGLTTITPTAITGKEKRVVYPMSGQGILSIINNQLRQKISVHSGDITYEDECIGDKVN